VELHTFYASQNIRVTTSREMRWSGRVTRVSWLRNAYNILVGKPEWRRPLGRPRRRWEDNIRTNLREIRWEDVDWIPLAQDRDQCWAVVNTVMNLLVP